MKTLADLKRRLTIGTKLRLKHLQSTWEPPIREINYIDTVKFGCLTTNKKGEKVTSYCDWPKAKDLSFIDNHTFIISGEWYVNGKADYMQILQYTIVEDNHA